MERRRFFGFAAGGAVAMSLKGGGNQLSQFMRLAFLRSPNFVAGSAGWTINQDGSAEFNNVTIRGGEVVDGKALFYSPTPGAGNLIASIAHSTGTDTFGNAYLDRFTSYAVVNGVHMAIQVAALTGGAGMILYTAPTEAGPWTELSSFFSDETGNLFLQTANAGQTTLVESNLQSSGDMLVGGKLTSTGGSAAAPTVITTDTWHSLGALGAHFTVVRGRYRLTPDNELELDISVNGDGSQATAVAFANTLPALYRPASDHLFLPLATNRVITAGDVSPRVQVTAAGVVTVSNSGTANSFGTCVRVPLD